MYWGFKKAFFKFHYMREYSVLNVGPAKSYFLQGKIQYKEQLRRIMPFSWGFSETTRETYILKDNHTLSPLRRKGLLSSPLSPKIERGDDNLFNSWFIGFLEGKGLFMINKNGNLEFKIVYKSTDASVLFYIKNKLGFGVVRIQDKVKNNHCFKVNDEKGLLNLISILNGNLFLDTKQKEFKFLIDMYNKMYGTTLVYLKNNNKPDLSNYWLSGFTDAVGSFTCIIKDNPDKNGLVKLSYTLSQDGNYNLMKYLAEILKGKIHYNNGIYETTVNTTKLSKIINYLKINPLKTNKSIIYLNIRKIYNLFFFYLGFIYYSC